MPHENNLKNVAPNATVNGNYWTLSPYDWGKILRIFITTAILYANHYAVK